jgi:hypothetical protein
MEPLGADHPGMPGQKTPLPGVVGALALRQHGVVARRQLAAAGMPSSTIDDWVAAGHLHRLHAGVYAVGHRLLADEGRWTAAVLACGGRALLSHSPAGQLQGILDRHLRTALHVSVTDRTRLRIPGIVVHRPRSLDPIDTTRIRSIPTTTATRTVWDLASTLPPSQTRRTFEQAEKLGLLNRPRLIQLLDATPNRKGAATIRALLAARSLPLAETRSRLEELLLEICADHALPLPAVNVLLLGYEVDFLWESARLVVEADGGDHLNPAQRDRDNERDIVLTRAGYLVRRYSWRALNDPAKVASELAALLHERSPG